MIKNIHIGYGDSATGCLKEAIEKQGLSGDDAIPSRDDFTQGPISDCIGKNGVEQRIAYWEKVEEKLKFGMDVRIFYTQSIQLLEEIQADQITLWVGNSCHDILATGWILSFLGQRNFIIYYVDLAKVESQDLPKGLPAVNLAMYTPEEVSNLWKYRTIMTEKSRQYYLETFNKACIENSHYRIQDNDHIVSVGEDYFDSYILSHTGNDFEPCSKVIGRILKEGAHRISDTTIEWNIRKMIDQGVLEFKGSLNDMGSYTIRKR